MSDRDTLADKLLWSALSGMRPSEVADHLIELGWRPPARVVADGGEIEAIAVEWMRYIGYTAAQIAEAEGQSCADTCERVGDAWDCTDQDGDSLHPVADELAASVAMANVAMETIEARGWRPPAREITTAAELDALSPLSIVLAMGQAFTAVDSFGRSWCAYGLAFPSSSAELLALNGGSVTVLYVPTEEAGR